ncbi:hypothetical protein [Paenibacillus medicaginis]|uniref:Uncharacterized protein n=1 Tax=Paenibacillus medicaginis TaxID=1470560 RepID=A0ABV5C382_9BACL
MQLVKLNRQEQFDALKKGDLVIVKWHPRSSEHRLAERRKKIAADAPYYIGHYRMVEVNRNNEIILQVRDNVYFNIQMYLDGESTAAEAYTIEG